MAAENETSKITELIQGRWIWEKSLQTDYTNHTVWLKYAEMEINNNFINRAREILDFAVSILPGNDQLWYKYSQMEEEMLENVELARQVFERWMDWMPNQQAWISYIDFELRYNEIDRARLIFMRFVECYPNEWIGYFKFEMNNGEVGRARNCYEKAVAKLGNDCGRVGFEEFLKQCKR